jgi:hypothetical protein
MSGLIGRSGCERGRVFLAALVAVATAVALVGSPVVAGAESAPTSGPPTASASTAAQLGAGYLARQLDAGVPLPGFGGPDWGLTLQAGTALAETGVGTDRLPGLWSAVEANRDTVVAPGGSDDPGRIARVVLLAVLIGENPRSVGSSPGEDMVTRLLATQRTTGSDAGLFGASDPLYDGAFRQGLAIAALVAAGAAVPGSAVDWLLAQQCADGSWGGGRSDLTVACTFDPDTYSGPDSNNTALALMGLVGAGETRTPGGPVDRGIAWLASAQEDDGGWSYRRGDGTDPNSTALVRRALAVLGVTTDDGVEDSTAALLSFQVGCAEAEPDRGGFASPYSAGLPDLIATVDAVPGAAGLPLPAPSAAPVAAVPSVECPTTTATSTTTTTTGVPRETTTTMAAAVPTGEVSAPAPESGTVPVVVAGSTSAAATEGARLAVTGGNVLVLLFVGTGLLVGGLSLTRPGRRRSP